MTDIVGVCVKATLIENIKNGGSSGEEDRNGSPSQTGVMSNDTKL
jgi:hypothetical protein